MKKLVMIFTLLFSFSILTNAQVKIVVLPFQNMDGNLKFNIYSYKLQDSVFKALEVLDPEHKYYQLIPLQEVEAILSEMNLDPTNPQYPSDMWKAVTMLNVQQVVTGNFNYQAERFLINAYIYDADTKLPNLANQARDIFKSEEEILSSVRLIIKRLKSAFIKE